MLDAYPKNDRDLLISIERKLSSNVGSVILQSGGINRYCLVSVHDALMILQIQNSWMNRSGIRKLRKRVFDAYHIEDVSNQNLVESIELNHRRDANFVTLLKCDGVSKLGLLEVDTARKLEHYLYVKQRAHRELFVRNYK